MQPKRTPPKGKGQGQMHAEQRKRAKSARDAAKQVNYKGGLTVAAVKNDSSLNATEKAKIIAIIKQNKASSSVEG